jgi:hypothetical protein
MLKTLHLNKQQLVIGQPRAMGGVSWRGENKEVARPTTIAWLKIEKFFDGKKSNQERKGRFLWLF